MLLRKAVEADLKDVLLLFRELDDYHLKNTKNIYKYITEELRVKLFLECIKSETTMFIVAEEDNRIIGFVHAFVDEIKDNPVRIDKRYLVIENLIVSEQYKRKHIGEQLMNYVEQEARKQDLDYMFLGVYEFNDAKKFYDKMGFYTITRKMKKDLK